MSKDKQLRKKEKLGTLMEKLVMIALAAQKIGSNISNHMHTMRTGLDFKSAQIDQVRGKAEDWIKMRELEI